MSIKNWIGGLIRKTPPTPSGPYQNSTAPGIWTLTQVANYIKQGIWPTAGNVNPDAFIENLFSTYLYTGNGSSQTITNGIDLSTKGGLVWFKPRNQAFNHALYDTARGTSGGYGLGLISNSTSAQVTGSGNYLTTFNSNGFTTSANGSTSGDNWVAWTFREQAKFFDVVTYTGNSTNRTIAHNLGSAPGCIIIKPYNNSGRGWVVYHRGLTSASYFLQLETTSAQINGGSGYFQNTAPTSTEFSLGTDPDVNGTGNTYVAYLFAHDAGGFGLSGSDNVISCGSYTGNGSTTGPVVTLGYEPQWLMVKRTDVATNWVIFDVMRGMSVTASMLLYPNLADDEGIGTQSWISPTATGFQPAITNGTVNANGGTYIYIAIRRGPMRTPTSGTSVYEAQTWSGPGSTTFTSFAPDWATRFFRDATNSTNTLNSARLIGERYLITSSTAAETADNTILFDKTGGGAAVSYGASGNLVSYYFRRAPSFFDVVCYTGTGSSGVVLNHNLTVVPELIITKVRNYTGEDWIANYNNGSSIIGGYLNSTSAFANSSTAPSTDLSSFTSTTYTLNTSNRRVNGAYNYVAYLFATCSGVSKVGSYTGTGTTLQVNCGFTGGARFVLIKRTDSTGDWYVWDSARGIVAGNDPYLLLNSTAAEVTGTDYVDTYSAGFEISSTAPAAINANGGTFIFLAIA